MNSYQLMHRALCIFVGVALFSTGCASSRNSSFYTLQALPSSTQPVWSMSGTRPLAIGIGPVTLADYLNRPQITTRTGPNELAFAEYDRWAGPLLDNLKRVLAEDLAVLLNTARISVYPWESTAQVEYQVKLDVQQFDGALGGRVELVAWWTIYDAGRNDLLLTRKSHLSATALDSTYQSLVLAENQILTELSREIANAIKTLAEAKPSS